MSALTVSAEQAHSFLEAHYQTKLVHPVLLGEGAWSRCFGFEYQQEALVVRFGHYLDDFHNDARAYRYASPTLPIPEVKEIGETFGGFFAISTRVFGVALESLNAQAWQRIMPSLVMVLEALRSADISATTGFGGWNHNGQAPCHSWAEHLLNVAHDTADRRTYGWSERLSHSQLGQKVFDWGFALLQELATIPVPRCLIHADLINRNVHVTSDEISGVFDWGCSLYGDHLYDLAWFEFWSPWYPKLDMTLLRRTLEQHWQTVGYSLEHQYERLQLCYLHIGLDHLAYNAYLEDWPVLEATARRMQELVD